VSGRRCHQRVEQPAHAKAIGLQQRLPRHRDQAANAPVEIREREYTLALRRAQFHPGNQATQVLPARLGRDQDGQGESGDLVMW